MFLDRETDLDKKLFHSKFCNEATPYIYEAQKAYYLNFMMSLVSYDQVDATRQYISALVAFRQHIIYIEIDS